MNYHIRTASRKELDNIIDWAAQEGWNPGLYDAEAFFATHPTGYLIGFLDDEPIASISSVSYGGQFGFLGLYIVRQEYRGKGYGIKIWNEGIKRLDGHNIGLDGLVAQQENYKKSGFTLAHRTIRLDGFGSSVKPNTTNVVNLSAIPFEQIAEYDNTVLPISRKQFLSSWLKQPESLSLGFVELGKLKGYGMVRKCRSGYKVGPLIADNAEIAETLFTGLKAFVGPTENIYLDVPEPNAAGVALAKRHKMKPLFESARMYTRKPLPIDLNKVFGVTTLELG